MIEEWRSAPGCDGYEVSNLGVVRRAKPYNSTIVGRPLKPRNNGTGYLCVTVSIGGKVRVRYISRLVCEAFNGPPPSDRHHAAHRNGIRSQNAADNLSWKLPVANAADKIEHGTYRQGSACARARLTEDMVSAIRRDHAAGATRKELARRHEMSANGIFCIITRKTWKHVA